MILWFLYTFSMSKDWHAIMTKLCWANRNSVSPQWLVERICTCHLVNDCCHGPCNRFLVWCLPSFFYLQYLLVLVSLMSFATVTWWALRFYPNSELNILDTVADNLQYWWDDDIYRVACEKKNVEWAEWWEKALVFETTSCFSVSEVQCALLMWKGGCDQ